MCLRNNEHNGGEPDAEPEVLHGPHALDQLDEASTMMPELPPPHAAQREPNAEDYMAWMIHRCSRRRDNAESHDRRRLYEERVTILHGLVSAMRSPVEALRRAALRTIAASGQPADNALN